MRPSQPLFVDRGVPVRLRRRRGLRRLSLSVSADGVVTLTAARTASLGFIERFLLTHAAWVRRTLEGLGWSRDTARQTQDEQTRHFERYREQALTVILHRLSALNLHYRFPFSRVTVRRQRGRWGSCSARGRLSFNYRLLFLPEALRDYVIVHELCHLRELNHSSRFWALVAETVPDYRERRHALRNISLVRPARS